MRDFTNTPLSQLIAEAAAFRGDVVASEDTTVSRIRAATHQLGWGVEEADIAADLVSKGATQAEAFLAVKAAKVL